MADMLVNLYEMPQSDILRQVEEAGVLVKRAMALDKTVILGFVEENFGYNWENECNRAIFNQPSSCYIATKSGKIVGFACYDATALGYFGPTGVLECERGQGIGKALLCKCLESMKEKGYGYAVIGYVGPVEYYEKAVNAKIIEGTSPETTVYSNLTWVGKTQ